MEFLNSWTGVLFIVLISLTLFVALRFFILWYFRINKIVSELEETNLILREMYKQEGGKIKDKS